MKKAAFLFSLCGSEKRRLCARILLCFRDIVFDDFEQLAPVCGGVHGNENIGKAVDGFHIAACRHPDHFCERLRDCSGDKVDFVLADFAGRLEDALFQKNAGG